MAKTSKARSKKQETQTSDLSTDEFRSMIAEAAYYKAEQRGFMAGFEQQDWIQAENDIAVALQQR